MSRYTLLVMPDGRALLVTPAELDPEEAQSIAATWEKWRTTPGILAIIAECSVEHVTSVEIDLPVGAA